ncbi:S8 family serine peptidase [Actinoplanes sp. L3-i22]|uniref:S8 family serine peptidase n=1 Tax=Actinoplanes sp. L3-i22 TaxID=2836373 RepID=UPI001C861E32|nr:S8 family serine peptidase [Actinoplanes sp. L3-i22]
MTVGLLSTALVTTAGAFIGAPAATADALPVRIVVGLKPGNDARASVPTLSRLGLSNAEAAGRKHGDLLALIGAKTLSVPSGKVNTTLAALRSDPSVAYAEIDGQSRVSAVTPNDPGYASQPELSQINVPEAWATSTGSDVVVAVVDSGVSPVGDLAGKVLDTGYDFFSYDNDPTDEGQFPHGTVVSSLIAATTDNGAGMAGVCWQCKILPVRVMGPEGWGYNSDIAQGVIYAAQHGAKIINLSLGGGYSADLAAAVAYATYSGVLVVAAAGNENTSVASYPAALPDVIAVGGTNTRSKVSNHERVYFSNWSKTWVDVAAPAITAGMLNDGTFCYDGTSDPKCLEADYPDDPYMVQGTSFSSPLVAGVAALVSSVHPDYNGWSLGNAIVKSTVPGTNSWTQYGLVDAAKALTIGKDTTAPTLTGITPAQYAPVKGTIKVTPTGLKDASGIGLVELYVNNVFKSRSYASPYAPGLNTTAYNGRINVRLKVTDKAGNVTMSGNRVLIVDNVKPKLTVTTWPANKAKIKGTVTIKAKATDVGTGVSKVQLLVNGKVVATDTKSAYALAFSVAKQSKTMKVQVRVYDKAGNYVVSSTRTYYRR